MRFFILAFTLLFSFQANAVTVSDCSFTNPGADRIFFWDHSESDCNILTAGTGLTLSGTSLTLNATGDWTGTLDGLEGAAYLARANHTGTQTASTISDFDEAAQDAVGGIFTDSSRIDFTYSDATPSITADLIADSVSNTYLANMDQATIKGRASGAGTGDPTDLSAAQVATIINSSIDHGSLTGLSDDDHTQYALLAGRSGGQTLIGGTASGNNLTLQSTSNATKGSIVINDGTNTWHNLSTVAGTATVFNETGADTDLRVEGDTDANLLFADASTDRVGFGTSAPTSKLTVSANSATLPAPNSGTVFHTSTSDGTGTRALIDSFGAGPSIEFRRANNTAASPAALASGDVIGQFAWFGYGSTGYSSTLRTGVRGITSQAWTDADQGADMAFLTTANGSATASERMRILNSGYIGMGTSAPDSPLVLQLQSGTAPTFSPGTPTFRIVGANSTSVVASYNSFNAAANFIGQRAEGTLASPTATAANVPIMAFAGRGYDTTNLYGGGSKIAIDMRSLNAWTSSDNSTQMLFQGTPSGSTTIGTWLTLVNSNVKIAGNASRGTTEGTNHLDIFNGTAPVGTLTNGISLYSTSGELRVMDSAGNATLLSPHDDITNEWIFYSKNTVTGKVLRIDMERLMKDLDKKMGGGYIKEYMEPVNDNIQPAANDNKFIKKIRTAFGL